MADKYTENKIKPIIEDLKAVWNLDNKDEWLKSFKKDLIGLVDKCYTDGFQDGHTEGVNDALTEPTKW